MLYSGVAATTPRLMRTLLTVFALLCLVMLSAAQARTSVVRAAEAPLKAVIIVGPTDDLTTQNLIDAEALALVAESYGMDVRRVFHPNATWANVMANVQGANLVVFMGHGNGWPSPYTPFQENTKDGIGINPYEGGSRSNTKYYGAKIIRENWDLAPNAIVFLNHLCYAAGNGEPGMSKPSWDIARQRVDNFAAGFIAAGARTVFAYSWQTYEKVIRDLFTTTKTMQQIFETPGAYPKPYYGWIGADARMSDSVRTPGTVNYLDPDPKDGFLRAVSGDLSMTAGQWRGSESSDWTPPTFQAGPTVPQGLTATAHDDRVVKLSWQPSTMNMYGSVKYIVFRNGNKIGSAGTATTYTNQPSKVGTYNYQVKAVDPSGIGSARTDPVSVQVVEDAGSSPSPTPSPTPDTTAGPPTVPQGLTATSQPDLKVALSWQASTSYVAGTTKYRVFRNGTAIGTQTSSLTYTDQVKSPGVWVEVKSDPESLVGPDTEPPSTPTGLGTKSLDSRRISLTWNASTDNMPGPVEYIVFRGKKRLVRIGETSYVDRPASVGTYKYRIKAIDAAGNKSYFTPRVVGVAVT